MENTRGKRKDNKPVDEVAETTSEKIVIEEATETMVKPPSEIETPSINKGIVNCHKLNVRKAPTTGSTILQVISKDTEVKILADVNETWYKIRIPEIETGFCMKEFISITD